MSHQPFHTAFGRMPNTGKYTISQPYYIHKNIRTVRAMLLQTALRTTVQR